jgi:glycosyltransferase involved in cell wall biosynthesis
LAFPLGDDGVRLVIKSTEFVPDHWGDPHGQWQALQTAALSDPRIHLIAEAMAFDDYLGLIACMDCVVSAHRAEGFGYLPAYSMLLGKPAIVTDYSGTQEYCDETTAFPVRATLRPVQPVEAYYPVEGAVWADVDVPHMAERMREVLADPASAQRRSAAGRARMEQDFSEAALAARYAARLGALGAIEANW